MGRTKGAQNKNSVTPSFLDLSPEDRLNLLANLIIDKVFEDQENGQILLKKIEGESHVHQPVSD